METALQPSLAASATPTAISIGAPTASSSYLADFQRDKTPVMTGYLLVSTPYASDLSRKWYERYVELTVDYILLCYSEVYGQKLKKVAPLDPCTLRAKQLHAFPRLASPPYSVRL